MSTGYQLSLLGMGQGRGELFGKDSLRAYLAEHEDAPMPDFELRHARLKQWVASIRSTGATEATLESGFVGSVFADVLGYIPYPSSVEAQATLLVKPSSRLTGIGRTPDAALGRFTDADHRIIAVVELKSPGAGLDVPQAGYDYKTPVAQALDYGNSILGVRWVVVSDMRVIRLYSVESGDAYEEVRFSDCTSESPRPNAAFRKLHFLFHHDNLIKGDSLAPVARLYEKHAARQYEIRDAFYEAYYNIRADLYDAIRTASQSLTPAPSRLEILTSTQRLLDRLLFICYCEDHPQQLITSETLKKVIQAARQLPGASTSRVYEYLKGLFYEIDNGSPSSSGVQIAAYNGELFKPHRVVDSISLPDSLCDKKYIVAGPDDETRTIEGVWGFHEFDFWAELNAHLLGHIFEESLSDLEDLGTASPVSISEKLAERKRNGIFFTASILSDFLSASALSALLSEIAPMTGESDAELAESIKRRIDALLGLRAVDLACGSGAFLVSLYRELLQEFWRLGSTLDALSARDSTRRTDLFSASENVEKQRQLPKCIFGVDLLPQAAEIAKLAIWLRSARKGQKVLDLSAQIVAANSLEAPKVFELLNCEPGSFDLVLGNPPWGGEVDETVYQQAAEYLGIPEDETWDSWELFVLLGLRALREGGRLALVLPDSLLYPEKERTRQLILEQASIEKLHVLGPDWFGRHIRMGTVVIQVRKGDPNKTSHFSSLLLSGELRAEAIQGKVPLTQIESQRSRRIPVSRVQASPTREIEVFRDERDDEIIDIIEANSVHLSVICERGRGEEINKAGLIWTCPSCLSPNTPGRKKKGGGYQAKACQQCGHIIREGDVDETFVVTEVQPAGDFVGFIDGDDVNRRYRRVTPNKWMLLGVPGWEYKDADLYRAPKILVRQAGVGIVATLDDTESRCPQSMYLYRLNDDAIAKGYRHEFVLAALLSRTMAYVVFKRFSEVDVAKAHAKLTHERLAALPIPTVDFSNARQRRAHLKIVENVSKMLAASDPNGSEEDLETELLLRELWGVSAAGAYINGEFFDLPAGQVIQDLFPGGRPRPQNPVEAAITEARVEEQADE